MAKGRTIVNLILKQIPSIRVIIVFDRLFILVISCVILTTYYRAELCRICALIYFVFGGCFQLLFTTIHPKWLGNKREIFSFHNLSYEMPK